MDLPAPPGLSLGSADIPALLKGLKTHPGPSGGPSDPSQTSRRDSRPRSVLRAGFPTPPVSPGGPHDTPGGPPDPSQPSGRASRLLTALHDSLPTPPGPLRLLLDPSWPSGRVSLPFVRDCLPHLAHREGLPTLPGLPRDPHDSIRHSERAFQPFLALQEGLLTSPNPLEGLPTPPNPPR